MKEYSTERVFFIETITDSIVLIMWEETDSKQRQSSNWGYDSKGYYFKYMIWNPEPIFPTETM